MSYTPTIVTSEDYTALRAKLGVTGKDLPDANIESLAYMEQVEAEITVEVDYQATLGGTTGPTTAEILDGTSPAVANDLVFLRAAVINRVAYLFAIAATNAVDTSVAAGPIQKSLGGIGAQWREQATYYEREVQRNLERITGWFSHLILT